MKDGGAQLLRRRRGASVTQIAKFTFTHFDLNSGNLLVLGGSLQGWTLLLNFGSGNLDVRRVVLPKMNTEYSKLFIYVIVAFF